MKVGGDLRDDIRRAAIVRQEIGPRNKLMMDANQRWDVGEAITSMRALAEFDPWWIEEPTNPDDVLGHATIAQAIRPSASPPEKTVPIASFLGSSCRRVPSISARSTVAAWAA